LSFYRSFEGVNALLAVLAAIFGQVPDQLTCAGGYLAVLDLDDEFDSEADTVL